jgi:hypothetical protein
MCVCARARVTVNCKGQMRAASESLINPASIQHRSLGILTDVAIYNCTLEKLLLLIRNTILSDRSHLLYQATCLFDQELKNNPFRTTVCRLFQITQIYPLCNKRVLGKKAILAKQSNHLQINCKVQQNAVHKCKETCSCM